MPYLKRSSPSDPDLRAAFRHELAQAAAKSGLAAGGPALWPRFAGYYQGLARLPRRMRRALQRQWRRSLGGLALLLALGQAPALAATITVDGATCTLVDAITAANSDQPTGGCPGGSGADTLVLPAGSTYTLNEANNSAYGPTGLPLVTSAITVEGNGSTITRESTVPAFRILAVGTGGDLTLQDTRLSGGSATEFGFPGNSGGGALARPGGTLTLTHCTVAGNSAPGVPATPGAGGGVANSGTLNLVNSTVSGNSAGLSGGGLFTDVATLSNSTVSGNSAGAYGGGLFFGGGGTLTLSNTTVSGNSANNTGGGLSDFAGAGTLKLVNSTVSGNSAGGAGGGIYNRVSDVALTNSTVSGNFAVGDGGGVFNGNTLTLVQTLVSGNLASSQGPEVYNRLPSNYAGTVSANAFNLFGHDGSAGVVNFTPGTTDLVPGAALTAILAPALANNGGPTMTHALVAGSPAIDRIPAASCATTTDQRGLPRPQDSDGDTVADCDIGAFEFAGTPPLTQADLSLTKADSPDPATTGQPLTYTLAVTNNGPASVTGVTVTDPLPGGVSFVSATPSRGTCSGTATVTCSLGSLANGESATLAIVVTPNSAGALSNTATVTGNLSDPNPGNNSATSATTVELLPTPPLPPPPPPALVPPGPRPVATCQGRGGCGVRLTCQDPSTSCTSQVNLTVRASAVRLGRDPGASGKARKRVTFAAAVVNVPPGRTDTFRLPLTKKGKKIFRKKNVKKLRGRLEVRDVSGAIVGNIPITIRLITIRPR